MRRAIFVIAVLGGVLRATAFASGPSDGFRSLKWGSEPLASMYKADQKANMQGYMRRDEDLTVLGTQASFIHYYYYGGGLCRVQITWWPQKPTTLQLVLKGLEEEWGQPLKSDRGNRTYQLEWVSSSGVTNGTFLAMEDIQTPQEDWFMDLIIQGRECSSSAIKRRGL